MNSAKRKVHDRRFDDAGPPSGWRERRRFPDRRLPKVIEMEITKEAFVQMLTINSASIRKAQEEANLLVVLAMSAKNMDLDQ